MRIDCHVHGDPEAFKGNAKEYVAACRERGVRAVVLIETAERCRKAVRKFGDFVIPVGRVQMDACSPREIEETLKAGCKGIKFIRPAAPYGDERYWPLYGKIEELGSVAVYHTGYVSFREREMKPVHIEHMRGAELDVVARRFPELKILMSHYSMPWWDEGWKVSWSNKNLYGDLSGGTAINRSTAMWADYFAPDGRIFEPAIRKLCFGTDVRYFVKDQYPFEPYIAFHEKIFDRMGLPQELRDLVNSGNTRALFGLKEK